MIDRTLVPYLAGFVVCVGAIFALVACTSPAEGPARTSTVVSHPAG